MHHEVGTLSDVAPFIQDVGVYAGVITATLLAFATLSRLAPIKFAMRKLIGEPIVTWVQHVAVEPALEKYSESVKVEIRTVVREHTDREEGIAKELRAEMRDTFASRSASFDQFLAAGTERMERVEANQTELRDLLLGQNAAASVPQQVDVHVHTGED